MGGQNDENNPGKQNCNASVRLFFGQLWHRRENVGRHGGHLPLRGKSAPGREKTPPENTLAALEQAIRDGAPIAEIDVQQLSDGTLIVMHDSNFKRTAGEDVCVWDTEADVLSTLEVGSTFSAAYRGEQIPTLEEMLACAEDRITLMIELKYSGQEQELEENVLALLQEYDMVDECIIGSMNRGILQRVKELEPDISTVYIAHDLGEDDYDLDYADSYSIEGKNLTADMVEAIHYEGKSVYGWTANTSGAMRQIVDSGADGIVTDDVRLLQAFLRENACRKAFESVY